MMKKCLQRNARLRPTIPELLQHRLLNEEKQLPAASSISKQQIRLLLAQLAKAGLSDDAASNIDFVDVR